MRKKLTKAQRRLRRTRPDIGFVIDRGLSPIDGKPYVAIMTLRSTNGKTGDVCQVFILREDVHPLDAIATGDDRSICGDCPHRRRLLWDAKRKRFVWRRSCYVQVGKSVSGVYNAYKRGRYRDWDASCSTFLRGRRIRWGAYGDPAIISEAVVRDKNAIADAHTGFTHQWAAPWAQWAVGLFQASCDSFADYLAASAAGWKTFAVVPVGDAAFSGKQCPATVDNSQAKCITCSLCNGAKTDIFVEAHGAGASYVQSQPVPELVTA
jgi:hypothetical protein